MAEDRQITVSEKRHFAAVNDDLAERFILCVLECQVDAQSACMRLGVDLEDIIRLSHSNPEVKLALQTARRYSTEGIKSMGRGGDASRSYFAKGLAASGFYEKLFSIAALANEKTADGKNDLFMLMKCGAIKATIPHESKLSVNEGQGNLDKMGIEELQKELERTIKVVDEQAKTLDKNNKRMEAFSKEQITDAEYEKAE